MRRPGLTRAPVEAVAPVAARTGRPDRATGLLSGRWSRGEVSLDEGLGDPRAVPEGQDLVGEGRDGQVVLVPDLDGCGFQGGRDGSGVQEDAPFPHAEFQELQSGEPGDLQGVGQGAGCGGDGAQARQSGERSEAEGSPVPVADGQHLQCAVGGGLDRLEESGADLGHGRKRVAAAATAFLPQPAQDEIGEGIGHELGAEALLVVDQDDLPEMSARAGGQVDRELVAAVAPEADPAGRAGQALHSGVGSGTDRTHRAMAPVEVSACGVDGVQVVQTAELAAHRVADAVRRLEVVPPVHPCHPVERLELVGQGDAQAGLGGSDLLAGRADGVGQPFAEGPLQQVRVRRRCRNRRRRRIGTAQPRLGEGALDQDEYPQVRVADSRLHGRARPDEAQRGPSVGSDLRPERDLLDPAARQRPLYVFHPGARRRWHGAPVRKAPAVLADPSGHAGRPGGRPLRVAGQHEP
ncbi:hypothetical protein Slala04_28920 [Streptomyces lavendulae subsp. lavendulae]|nr:hypothetical protein Slala04_28920 [Streptomyces lavendulae subsp. lavendulae]